MKALENRQADSPNTVLLKFVGRLFQVRNIWKLPGCINELKNELRGQFGSDRLG
jgi:hypothetical protein